MTQEERENYIAANRDSWNAEEAASRDAMNEEIMEFSRKLDEDLRNQKIAQEKVAFTLSRFSPASAYQLTAMHLASTGTELKSEYEDAMKSYRAAFTRFVDEKREAEQRANRGRGFFGASDNQDPLDISEMPRFDPPRASYRDAVSPTILDFGLLSVFSLVAFSGAFVAFLRYDVR